MEERELLEIEARESEQAKKNIDEMLRRNTINDIWLLYKDKFNLSRQKVCHPFSLRIPPQTLIPIFDKVLVPIMPLPSQVVFENETGCTVDQILEWRRKGWVETFLSSAPRNYGGLDYLSELIEVSPCSATRTAQYTATLCGGMRRLNDSISKGKAMFRGIKADRDFIRYYGEERGRQVWLGQVASSYADLIAYNLGTIVERIVGSASVNLDELAAVVYVSSILLIEPLLSGLKQTSAYGYGTKIAAEKVYEVMRPKGRTFFAPCWLADVYKNLEVTIFPHMDSDQIQVIRKSSEKFLSAVKSLDDEIDTAVREKFGGGELDESEREAIMAKKEEFRKRWEQDVKPELESIARAKQAWSIMVTTSIIAPVLALAAFKDVLALPEAMLAALSSWEKIKQRVDPIAEYITTFFECNPIHVGFYKVDKEIKKLRRKRR